MIKIVQGLEWKLTGVERNLRKGEEQGLVRSELSKSRKSDNDRAIYRLQKRKVSTDRPGSPIEWPARSARKVLADRLACSIRILPVLSATLFECFATVFDISISIDDDTNTIEFLVKLLSVPTTISNIQSSVSHVSMSFSIEFDCFSSFDSSFDWSPHKT